MCTQPCKQTAGWTNLCPRHWLQQQLCSENLLLFFLQTERCLNTVHQLWPFREDFYCDWPEHQRAASSRDDSYCTKTKIIQHNKWVQHESALCCYAFKKERKDIYSFRQHGLFRPCAFIFLGLKKCGKKIMMLIPSFAIFLSHTHYLHCIVKCNFHLISCLNANSSCAYCSIFFLHLIFPPKISQLNWKYGILPGPICTIIPCAAQKRA